MVIYDKLKNMETEERRFDFMCPHCGINGMKKNGFTITPIGISWKPDMIDNNDIENKQYRDGYNKLPNKRNAIFIAHGKHENGSNLIIECSQCKKIIPVYDKIKQTDLRKWANKNLPFYMDLRVNKDGRGRSNSK